jgi:2-polyprenyl-6-methoxyphenol hydroxylase-like FAD-dependent oxidoreductase
MAGAILLAVAIVGLGMYLFGQARGVIDISAEQIDTLGVSGVNSRILQYEGDNVRGTNVKQLLNWVDAANARGVFPTAVTKQGVTDPVDVVNTQTYTVDCTIGADGYVSIVNVN